LRGGFCRGEPIVPEHCPDNLFAQACPAGRKLGIRPSHPGLDVRRTGPDPRHPDGARAG
jgi:hypothetical protein